MAFSLLWSQEYVPLNNPRPQWLSKTRLLLLVVVVTLMFVALITQFNNAGDATALDDNEDLPSLELGENLPTLELGDANDIQPSSENNTEVFDVEKGIDDSEDDDTEMDPTDNDNTTQSVFLHLVDDYPETKWPLTPVQQAKLLKHIGGGGACSQQTERTQVRLAFSEWGFGSNLLRMFDSVLIATYYNRKFMLVSREDQPKKLPPIYLEDQYLRHFYFPNHPVGTVCRDYVSACGHSFIGKLSMGERCDGNGPKLGMDYVETLRKKKTEYFLGTRVFLSRYFMALQPKSREIIDNRMKDFLAQIRSSKSSATIHVRRSDKVSASSPESKNLSPLQYATAFLAIEKSFDLIFVVTDDGTYSQKIIDLLAKKFKKAQFVLRAQGRLRPDQIAEKRLKKENSTTFLDSSMIEALVDIKLMVMADCFLGTKSSNFGEVAAYLRGGTNTYDAEGDPPHYVWKHQLDKVTL